MGLTIGSTTYQGAGGGGQEVVVDDTAKALIYGGTGITSIEVPASSDRNAVKEYALSGLTALTSVTLPANITEIKAHTFDNDTALTYISGLGATITTLDDYALYNTGLTSITFPGALWRQKTSLGEYAISGNAKLTELTVAIPTSIGARAFYNNTALTKFVWIDNAYKGLTTLPEGCFQNCTKLKSVIDLPSSLMTIGNYAFQKCESLEGITLPSSLTTIGQYAFSGCKALSGIDLPTGQNLQLWSNCFEICWGLTTLTIPSNVTVISGYAFNACKALQTVYVKRDTPPEMGSYVFNGCTALESIYVPYNCYDAYIGTSGWSDWKAYIKSSLTVTSYLELNITADDVTGNKTTTTVHWTEYVKGIDMFTGNEVEATLTGDDVSDAFDQNTDTESSRSVEVSYTRDGLTTYATITQGPYVDSDLFVGENEIDNSDETKTQYTIDSRTGRLYKFLAQESLTYTFRFDDRAGSNTDTYGFLFDSSMTTLKTNDDGYNNDPKIDYAVTAGETYYFMVTPYSRNSTTNVTGTLEIYQAGTK